MKYRQFGKLDFQASALGFGCMRLPTEAGDHTKIIEPEATEMLHYAIDHGVNYLDTAWPYHGGESERLVGRALRGGYREKVRVATKLPTWDVKAAEDFDRFLDEQLEKLQTDYIDFYLLHSLNKGSWQRMRELGITSRGEKAIADGRIRHLGFSLHDQYEVFQDIVDGYDAWTFCQIQYNYMDVEHQAGARGLRYAASKGLAVVIMEPLLGGRLVNPPDRILQMWDGAPEKRTAAEWALHWLWHQPEVSLVLSGMSAMEQVTQNVESADRSGLGLLSDEELALVDRVRETYRDLCPVPCTKCEYCLPCTVELNIPQLFEMLNSGVMYNELGEARRRYAGLPEDKKADACSKCQECEESCPQQIPISEYMVHIHEVLGQGQSLESCFRESDS